MTDSPPKQSTAPMLGLQAMGATGSYFAGDKLGDAIAQIVAWIIAVKCNCTPPSEVVGAVHSISVAAVMILAIIAQHKLIKNLNN